MVVRLVLKGLANHSHLRDSFCTQGEPTNVSLQQVLDKLDETWGDHR